MRRWTTMMAASILALGLAHPGIAFGQATAEAQAGNATEAPRRAAPAAARPAARPVDPARLEWLLKKWEAQSAQLKTLDVQIARTDFNPVWDELEYYSGRALFKSPNLAFIDFNKAKQDENKKPLPDPKNPKKWLTVPHERIICTGNEVWQYQSDTQKITIFPLGKDEKAKALEEGPLPFLFNMRADDAKRRYDMELISEDAKGYGISIKPKLEDDQQSFSSAKVLLDRQYLLPVWIIMVSPDGKGRKDFKLSDMKANTPVNDKNFVGVEVASWKIIRNPTNRDVAGESAPGGAPGRPRRDAQGKAAALPRAGGLNR